MPFLKRDLDRLAYDPAGRATQIQWEGSLAGFGFRVFPSGAKSFIMDYRFQGTMRRLTLGRYGVLTPKQARDDAVKALAKVARIRRASAARSAIVRRWPSRARNTSMRPDRS